MFCSNCGFRIPDDACFCPECGCKQHSNISKKNNNLTYNNISDIADKTNRNKVLIICGIIGILSVTIIIALILITGFGTSILAFSKLTSGNKPSKAVIESDIPTTLEYDNPISWQHEQRTLDIESLEITKELTEDSKYTAYISAVLSDDCYRIKKNYIMEYQKYDNNLWEIVNCSESIESYNLLKNPFTEEDVYFRNNGVDTVGNIYFDESKVMEDNQVILMYDFTHDTVLYGAKTDSKECHMTFIGDGWESYEILNY